MMTENYIKIEEINHIEEDEIGLSIIKSEFINVIHDLKSNKAVGIDEITAELQKVVREDTGEQNHWKVKLCLFPKRKSYRNLEKDQFGFRQGLGITEVILALKIITERRLNMNRNTYIGFIDIEKAFDTEFINDIIEKSWTGLKTQELL